MNVSQPKRQLRLREKLLTQGVNHLSDAELLAIFLSYGHHKKNCLQLAFDLMQQLGDLRAIINTDYQGFKQIPGLGLVRYVQLQALVEICRRADFIGLQKTTLLENAYETYTFLKRKLRDKKNETFVGLFLDNQHRILTYEELFNGTINTVTVHTRPIIQRVLKLNAAALILAHNHPSGYPKASEQDQEITVRLRVALELVDARLLDHLIIGDNEIYSIMHGMKWSCH